METKVGKCLCGEPEKVIIENGKQVLERCPLYIKLMGKDPQTGMPVEEWGCSIAWIPILLIETTQQTRQAGAAIESFRNEMVTGNKITQGFLAANVVSYPPRGYIKEIKNEDIIDSK